MFYSNNDYMQDLYYYNQIPNNNTYNPNMNFFGNNMMDPNYMNNGMCMNNNQMNMHNNQSQNLNNLYPSVYRIIMPVVSRVVSNNNYPYFNEDVLNNMVDTVYNIVEGQIEYNDEPSSRQSENNSSNNNSNQAGNTNSSNTTNQNTRTSSTSDTRQTTSNSNINNSRNDSLLRDLIKILIIREIIERMRFQQQQQQFMSQSYNMNF